MERKAKAGLKVQEDQLLHIMRRLEGDRLAQLLEFALFLEMRQAQDADGNDKWDELLASDEGQGLLEKMADEAVSAIAAGRANPMRFTDDGRLRP